MPVVLSHDHTLLPEGPDGGQPLECHGDVGVHWTASCVSFGGAGMIVRR